MKAKQYAEKFIECKSEKEALELLVLTSKDILIEMSDIMKARNISREEGIRTTVKEFDNKYRTFSSLVNQMYPNMVRPDGLLMLIKHYSPEIYQIINN